jgi:hypothetical protein
MAGPLPGLRACDRFSVIDRRTFKAARRQVVDLPRIGAAEPLGQWLNEDEADSFREMKQTHSENLARIGGKAFGLVA